jgi:hypothetical protein
MRNKELSRIAALLAVPLLVGLGGCGGPAAPSGPGRFDGTYSGTLQPATGNNPDCDTRHRSIRFQVAYSRIAVHSRHKHHQMDGTVSADGALRLRAYSGGRVIQGRIANGVLSATETDIASGRGQEAREGSSGTMCTFWVQAARRATAPAPVDPED